MLYSDERFAAIAKEAAKGDAVFSLNDHIGLVHDVMALSKAGFCKVSSALMPSLFSSGPGSSHQSCATPLLVSYSNSGPQPFESVLRF